MKPTEVADELSQHGALELLAEAQLARLAYTGVDDAPRVIPIGFIWNGTAIVMCTATMSPKVVAIRRRPELAITIDVGSSPAEAKALLVRGAATVEIVNGVPDEFIAGSAKTMNAEDVADFAEQARATYPQMARITLAPTWARYFDFGAGRMPAFLTELANG